MDEVVKEIQRFTEGATVAELEDEDEVAEEVKDIDLMSLPITAKTEPSGEKSS